MRWASYRATSMLAAAAVTSERALSSMAWLCRTAASAVLTWAWTSSRAASDELELAPGLVEQAAGLRPLVEELLDALVLGLPAGEVGVGPLDAGLDLRRAWPRRWRGWPGPPPPRPRPAASLASACSTAACFCSASASSSGTLSSASTWPFFTLVADVHGPLLHVAGDLGVDRRHLVRLDLARLADAAADGLPLGPDDLDAQSRPGRIGPPCSSDDRAQPAAVAARTSAAAVERRSTRDMAELAEGNQRLGSGPAVAGAAGPTLLPRERRRPRARRRTGSAGSVRLAASSW